MAFHVGQKVVCVDASFAAALKVDAEYVVTKTSGVCGGNEYICVKNGGGLNDGGWMRFRFRPVVEKKTDISIFTQLLSPSEIEKAKRELIKA